MNQHTHLMSTNTSRADTRVLNALLCRLQLWRQHFDFQLYKALDVQFRAGLESLHKSLTEVRAASAAWNGQ